MKRRKASPKDPDELRARARKALGSKRDEVAACLGTMDNGGTDDMDHGSMRVVQHKGRTISIKTHYDILVDGEPLGTHVGVDRLGRVHAHGLPNYQFGSLVDLVKALLDQSDCETGLPDDSLGHIYGHSENAGGDGHGHS